MCYNVFLKTNITHNMFISEQFGWLDEISGDFLKQILISHGSEFYELLLDAADDSVNSSLLFTWIRDIDMMLMGL